MTADSLLNVKMFRSLCYMDVERIKVQIVGVEKEVTLCCVFLVRCPPLMDIVLHMLNGYLLASKAYLQCHLKETADFDRQSQTVSNLGVPGQPETAEVTREELKNALLAAQVF